MDSGTARKCNLIVARQLRLCNRRGHGAGPAIPPSQWDPRHQLGLHALSHAKNIVTVVTEKGSRRGGEAEVEVRVLVGEGLELGEISVFAGNVEEEGVGGKGVELMTHVACSDPAAAGEGRSCSQGVKGS